MGATEWKKFSKSKPYVFGAMVKLESQFTFKRSEEWSSSAGRDKRGWIEGGEAGRIELISQTNGRKLRSKESLKEGR